MRVLRLNDDRTIDVDLDGTQVQLRPPTIGEWRKIRDTYLTADAGFRDQVAEWEARNADPDVTEPGPRPDAIDYVWSDANPYGQAFAVVIATLSNQTPDADRLPMWASSGSIYATLHDHWRKVPVTRANEPAPLVDPPFDPVAAGLTGQPATPPEQPARPLPRAVQGFVNQQGT